MSTHQGPRRQLAPADPARNLRTRVAVSAQQQRGPDVVGEGSKPSCQDSRRFPVYELILRRRNNLAPHQVRRPAPSNPVVTGSTGGEVDPHPEEPASQISWRAACGQLDQKANKGLVDQVLGGGVVTGVGGEPAAEGIGVLGICARGKDGQRGDRLPPGAFRAPVAVLTSGRSHTRIMGLKVSLAHLENLYFWTGLRSGIPRFAVRFLCGRQ